MNRNVVGMSFVTFIISNTDYRLNSVENNNTRNGIQWTLTEQMVGLDFMYNITLLSYTQNQLQN